MEIAVTRRDIALCLQDNNSMCLPGEGRVEPNEFCEQWIPKLYGVVPGENLYRKACIEEFVRWLGVAGVTRESIRSNWVWLNDEDKNTFPKYLPVVLGLLDKQYAVLEKLGHLPRYEVTRDQQQ